MSLEEEKRKSIEEFLVKLEEGDKIAKKTEQEWGNITFLKNWFWREIREYKERLNK